MSLVLRFSLSNSSPRTLRSFSILSMRPVHFPAHTPEMSVTRAKQTHNHNDKRRRMNKSNISNTLVKLITVLTHVLIMSGCLLSTNLKSPTLVKWEETKVVLDTVCRDTEKWYEKCKNRFNKKAALNLAQKYCSFSNRVAHPDYYWNCADTSSHTKCTTSEAIAS